MKIIIVTLAFVFNLLIYNAPKKGYDVGDKVADFNLKNVDGKYVSLSDYKSAKGIILIFDCNTCPVSKLYNSRIIDLHKKYSELNFPVITINSNDAVKSPLDSYDEMVKEAKAKNYDFAYLWDDTQTVAQMYGASNTPHVFVLVKENEEVKVAYIGGIDDNARDASKAKNKYVEEAVDALLKGSKVSVTKTKAIGCGIKWRDA